MTEVDSARVVVVGASSGLGRAIAVGVARRAARVAMLARRLDRLQSAAAEAGGGAVAVECDVRDETMCAGAMAEAAAVLGGIDALVYAAAIGPLARLADTGAEAWRSVLDTNVVGAAVVTKAAVPHLEANGGRAVYLSSMSASLTPPWPGLGAYAASKAALDKLVEAWAVEHPLVRFTRLVVGNTAGGDGDDATGFTDGWDHHLAEACLTRWAELGYLDGGLVAMDTLVDAVAGVIASDDDLPNVFVGPGG